MPNMGPEPKALSMRAIASPPVISLVWVMLSLSCHPGRGRQPESQELSSTDHRAYVASDLLRLDAHLVLEVGRIADWRARCAEALHRGLERADARARRPSRRSRRRSRRPAPPRARPAAGPSSPRSPAPSPCPTATGSSGRSPRPRCAPSASVSAAARQVCTAADQDTMVMSWPARATRALPISTRWSPSGTSPSSGHRFLCSR